MKKNYLIRIITILLCITVISSLFVFSSCNDTPDEPDAPEAAEEITVTFDYNYEGAPSSLTQKVEVDDIAEQPSDPERENYSFLGWYSDAECKTVFDFEETLSEDTTVYAGWKLVNATVIYYLNDGTDGVYTQQLVEVKTRLAEPAEVPARTGYIFSGWYSDKECTAKFVFGKKVETNLSLYASWTANLGDNVTVTYMWNYEGAANDGVYSVRETERRTFLDLPEPYRTDYKFMGWYTDNACTTEYDNTVKINEDKTLYALWYSSATFEAEHVDMTDLVGYGYSGSVNGAHMIGIDKNSSGASNGYFVGYLYNKGLTLSFKIDATEAIDNVWLYLRASAEIVNLTLKEEYFTFKVNGTEVSWGGREYYIDCENVQVEVSGGMTEQNVAYPFDDYLIATNVSLKQGSNTIDFIIDNLKEEHTGTMYSHAPVVDCIRLVSAGEISSKVSWSEGYPKTDNEAKADLAHR